MDADLLWAEHRQDGPRPERMASDIKDWPQKMYTQETGKNLRKQRARGRMEELASQTRPVPSTRRFRHRCSPWGITITKGDERWCPFYNVPVRTMGELSFKFVCAAPANTWPRWQNVDKSGKKRRQAGSAISWPYVQRGLQVVASGVRSFTSSAQNSGLYQKKSGQRL